MGVHGVQQPRRRSARHGWVGSKGPFDHRLQCTRILRPKEAERRSAHSVSSAIVGHRGASALVFGRFSVLVLLAQHLDSSAIIMGPRNRGQRKCPGKSHAGNPSSDPLKTDLLTLVSSRWTPERFQLSDRELSAGSGPCNLHSPSNHVVPAQWNRQNPIDQRSAVSVRSAKAEGAGARRLPVQLRYLTIPARGDAPAGTARLRSGRVLLIQLLAIKTKMKQKGVYCK